MKQSLFTYRGKDTIVKKISAVFLIVTTNLSMSGLAYADAPARLFSASIAPTTVQVGELQTYTVTIANDVSSDADIKSATIDQPVGWSFDGASLSLGGAAASGYVYSFDAGDGRIEISLISGPDGIAPGDSFTVTFDATAPYADGTDQFEVRAFKNNSYSSGEGAEFDQSGSEPEVVITEPEEEDLGTVRVVATKIVCQDESYLPNWGAGYTPIDSATVDTFLSNVNEGHDEPVCWIDPSWNFQWAPQDTSNPSDNSSEATLPWTTFNQEAVIAIADLADHDNFSVREVWNNDYVTFAGATTTQHISAEMYCHIDTLKYDNYDRVDGPFEDGATYYCVAFNAYNQAPVITLTANPLHLTVGDVFDPYDGHATAQDFEDGDITASLTATGTVDTSVVGDYTVEYTVHDAQGKVATPVTLSIHVVEGENDEDDVDVCPNIDGVQKEVPAGKKLSEGQCVNIPAIRGGGGRPAMPFVQPVAGLVLGASTSSDDASNTTCTEYLNDYLRMGKKNNPEQVMKLQSFLNKHVGTNLPVTGYFGSMTFDAVQKFQLEHADQILTPWVPYGLESNTKPTGYVYKTTKRWINILECTSLNTPMPILP